MAGDLGADRGGHRHTSAEADYVTGITTIGVDVDRPFLDPKFV